MRHEFADQFEANPEVDFSLSDDLKGVRNSLSEIKDQIPEGLKDVVLGFEYLLDLAENDLLYGQNDDIIPFWSATIDLCDQFMEAQGPLKKIQTYFERELQICFDKLPKHLKNKHNQNINAPSTEPEVKNAARKFPTKVAAAIALGAIITAKSYSPEAPKTTKASLTDQPAGITSVLEDDNAPLIIQGKTVIPIETVAIPEPRPEVAPVEVERYSPVVLSFAQRETPGMNQRFNHVINNAGSQDLFADILTSRRITKPADRERAALISVLESNTNPDAVSGAGAKGMYQDMGKLQGAFGDPRSLNYMIRTPGLLPAIGHTEYENAKARGAFVLLEFLKGEKADNSEFWQRFVRQQTSIITDPEKSQIIAHYYLESLQSQATRVAEVEADSIEARNLGIMAYNVGMKNMRRLHRAMELAGVAALNTESALSFIERADFRDLLHDALMKEARYSGRSKHQKAQMLSAIFHKLKEGQGYIARYIALENALEAYQQGPQIAQAG